MGLTKLELKLILDAGNITIFTGVSSRGMKVLFAAIKHDPRLSGGMFLTNDENYAHLNERLKVNFGFRYGCRLEDVVAGVFRAFRSIQHVRDLTLYDLV